MAKTGNRRVPFVADTGCLVNNLPARLAAKSGLKWQDVERDESTFMTYLKQSVNKKYQSS